MSLVDVNNNKIEDPNDPKGFYSAPVDSFKEKSQYLCACGLSKKLPFCDGTHFRENTPYKPVEIQIVGDNILIRPKKELVLLQQKALNEKKAIENKKYLKVGVVLLTFVPIFIGLFNKTKQ